MCSQEYTQVVAERERECWRYFWQTAASIEKEDEK